VGLLDLGDRGRVVDPGSRQPGLDGVIIVIMAFFCPGNRLLIRVSQMPSGTYACIVMCNRVLFYERTIYWLPRSRSHTLRLHTSLSR
jgi:hypothetical protein